MYATEVIDLDTEIRKVLKSKGEVSVVKRRNETNLEGDKGSAVLTSRVPVTSDQTCRSVRSHARKGKQRERGLYDDFIETRSEALYTKIQYLRSNATRNDEVESCEVEYQSGEK